MNKGQHNKWRVVLNFAIAILLFLSNSVVFGRPGKKQDRLTTQKPNYYLFKHPRSISHKTFEVWRSPGRFTKNPDMIRLPSGRLMLVYSDTDSHWSQEDQILTLLASDDNGKTWFKHREIVRHDLRKGDERLITPRLSRLNDGRLVVLIDQDDYSHFHEDQPPGILAFWSEDDGDTWSKAQNTGIKGFEPDRMIDLPDGRLAVCSHLMRGDTQAFADIISCSDDGGKTWYEQATIAHDGYHFFCEGTLVILDGGKELACVMRENHSGGIPSFVAFSKNMGRTWSEPRMLPFAIHRPYAKQLKDGRVLVTGRHVNGGLGTYAWCGDLRAEAGQYQIGGPRQKYAAKLTSEALVIENKPGHECRYSLLPPETSKSEIVFEAEVKVEGPPGEAVAFISISKIMTKNGPLVLWITPDGITLTKNKVNFQNTVDMTRFRKVTLHHRRGLLRILVDGRLLINQCVHWESYRISDSRGGDVTKRTQFGQGGESGRSFWKRISYSVDNPTLQDFNWSWQASSGEWPDQYQRNRLIQIHANPPYPNHKPDHGYSSWVVLDDGKIMFVDYTNFGDQPGKSHLVGVYIEPEDIKPPTEKQTCPAAGKQYFSATADELGIVLADEITVGGVKINPASPPKGLKTYTDLGIVIEECMIARRIDARPESKAKSLVHSDAPPWFCYLSDGKTLFAFHHNCNYPEQPPSDTIARGELWCSVSRDQGKTWSKPRFVLANATKDEKFQISDLDIQRPGLVHLYVSLGSQQVLDVYFQEYHLQRLATRQDLAASPPGQLVRKSVSMSDHSEWKIADTVCVGDIAIRTDSPPEGLAVRKDIGLLTHALIDGQVVHRSWSPSRNPRLYETRATITPGGDYLLMFPNGIHATGGRTKRNDLLAYRSSDKGKTWKGPVVLFGWEYNHRAFIPLVPRGSSRLYAFCSHTARSPNPIGCRYSDDDGYTWSDITLIEPVNKRRFGATAVIQMCETDAGTWLLGFHGVRMLRGEKQGRGRVWTAVPLNRPNDGFTSRVGWKMDELRVINLEGRKVLAFARTREGHVWQLRSDDDGKTWSDPKPTVLVHPDAPPMVFHLSDGKTLIALHHNRYIPRTIFDSRHKWRRYPSYDRKAIEERAITKWSLSDWVSRAEVWFSISKDEGKSWSEPRFLFANALDETLENANRNYQCSYVDLFADGDDVHLFVPHRWRQVLHLHFKQSDLEKFPTKSELFHRP